jgi:uracil-DNA glycosylase
MLVLGESHYGLPDEATPDLTKNVVLGHVGDGVQLPFFDRVGELLAYKPPFQAFDRREIWNAVAFYNFVQRFPGLKPGCRPSKQDWNAAMLPFLAVVDELRPHAVLVLGRGIWNHISFQDGTASTVAVSDYQRLWTRPNGWKIAAGSIYHPTGSRGFSGKKWKPFVDDLLARGMENLGGCK